MIRWLVLLLLLSGCSIYKNSFDCPPHQGVGCKSVSEIEEMVTERDEGPDLFFASEIHTGRCNGCSMDKQVIKVDKSGALVVKGSPKTSRIWVADELTPSGNRVESHYLYFTENDLEKWSTLLASPLEEGESDERR